MKSKTWFQTLSTKELKALFNWNWLQKDKNWVWIKAIEAEINRRTRRREKAYV
jgi:hypothetical protein